MPDDVGPPGVTVPPIPTPEGPATTAEYRARHEDIGPFYKFLGFCGFLILGAIAGAQVIRGHQITVTDLALYTLVILLIICIVRPNKFDNAVKTIADKLPGKYSKPDA